MVVNAITTSLGEQQVEEAVARGRRTVWGLEVVGVGTDSWRRDTRGLGGTMESLLAPSVQRARQRIMSRFGGKLMKKTKKKVNGRIDFVRQT